eukprot:11165171-Lingulodinium_polyedra.AAC.1
MQDVGWKMRGAKRGMLQCLGRRMQDARSRMYNAGCRTQMQEIGCKMRDADYGMQDANCRRAA